MFRKYKLQMFRKYKLQYVSLENVTHVIKECNEVIKHIEIIHDAIAREENRFLVLPNSIAKNLKCVVRPELWSVHYACHTMRDVNMTEQT